MSDDSHISDIFETFSNTPRQKFLQSRGFQHDPFQFHATEQQWGLSCRFSGEKFPLPTWLTDWSDYFQPHTLESDHIPAEIPPPDNISTVLLVGSAGTGKTALLYHWMEKEYRDKSDTLVVFYDFAELNNVQTLVSLQEFGFRGVVVALILHLLRDFKSYPYESVQQWLGLLITLGGEVVRWWARYLLEQVEPRDVTWQLLRYPLLYPLEINSARRQLLELICSPKSPFDSLATVEPTPLYLKIIPILEALNIRQIQLYIDNLAQAELDLAQLLTCNDFISMVTVPYLYHRNIRRFITIPQNFAEPIYQRFTKIQESIQIAIITIKWKPNQLGTLLHKRCCTEKGWVALFEGATESEPSYLENHIIEQATESPRRLLMMVSALLDAHASCTPSAEQLTEALWEFVRSHWEFEGNPPEALPKHI